MAHDSVEERQQAHAYLDRLPPEQVSAVRHLLKAMLDPISRAQVEGEPISAEEERSVAEAREWLRHNKPIPNEEILAELGLTSDDFERMGRTPLPPEHDITDR